MKKMCKKLILIVAFLNAFCILTCGINNQAVYAASNSINETMSKEEIMGKYYELKRENQDLIKEYDNLRGEWSTKKDNIDNRIKTIELIGAVAFLLIVSVYGLSLKQMKKYINDKIKEVVEKEVNDKVPKEVAEKVGIEVDRVRKVIDDNKKEEKLMKEKSILVISKNNEEEKLLTDSNLLKQFKKVQMSILGDQIDNLSEYDVIIFNDINGYLEDEEMNKIIEYNYYNKRNAVYLYFTRNYKRTFKSNKANNTNFAKSNSTFVGNLIDLMNYQEDVLKNNKSNNESIGCTEEIVMKILIKHEGEKFFQKRGQDFTYKIKGKYIVPSTTKYNIPISDIVKGLKRGVVTTTTQLQDLRGPSYIYAFVNDDRFNVTDE